MFLHLANPHETADQTAATSDSPIGNVSRRGFIAQSGALVLALALPIGPVRADATAAGLKRVAGDEINPTLFVRIETDGTVIFTCHRSEMGQQVWTAATQVIADELEADWSRVHIEQAIGHPRYGNQNTDGSTSFRGKAMPLLRATGAAMRTMLEAAAAKRWNIDPSQCRAQNHRILGPGGRSMGFGDVAEQASRLAVPALDTLRLKLRKDWNYIGRSMPSRITPLVVRGEGIYGQDVRLPDMLYAVVARPPVVFGTLQKLDDKAAIAVAGVIRTVTLPQLTPPASFSALGGVAVVASDTWAAIKGRRALKAEWSAGANGDYDSAAFREQLLATARKPGAVRRSRGDVDAGFKAAAKRITAEYYTPHLNQSPMEPPAATARWNGDKVECWACVQAPQTARSAVAKACGIEADNVTINVTWLGGGFGRKSKPDFVVEAALIARQVGRPVKVVWTREDDTRHGYYHSVSAQRLEAGLDDNGVCTALLHRTVFPPIPSTFTAGETTPSWGELRLGASDNPFITPNLRLETGDAPAKIRIGWLRAVANIYHAFALQSFVAELAAAAGRDPKDYLLEMIGPPRFIDPGREGAEYNNYGEPLEDYPIDTGRLANVVNIAAAMASWGRKLPAGRGLGIAAHRSFLSYVATVIEVDVSADGALTIVNVWSAIDAGTVVNPRHVEAQVEGGTLYGLSNALYGEISVEDGAIVQSNFPDWRVMRINEAPRQMSVTIVDSDAPPGGVGEPPTPPAAPALANAIFAATGTRYRQLPIFGADSNKRLTISNR